MAQPRLSLCMIVRNEQEMLPDLLLSVHGLWDELIVADTGSTDDTVPLLEAAGARIIHHPWADDFAAARNASLAAATGDWVLFLDADERMTPALAAEIQNLMADTSAGAATVVMRNTLPEGTHHDANLLRLFRNDPTVRFRHRIHEDVMAAVNDYLVREHLLLRHLTGVVEHLGYAREVAADKGKRRRDQDLLRRVLAEDPRDFYCWFKLLESARFWADQPLWQAVAAEVEPLFSGELTDAEADDLRQNPWSGELAALISEGLFSSSTAALDWLEESRDRVFAGVAWHLRRALLLESLGRTDDAAGAFDQSLAGIGPTAEHLRVRIVLGQCRLKATEGDLGQAHSLATTAVNAAPADPEALLAAITFTKLSGGADQMAALVAQHRQEHPELGVDLAEALLRAGQLARASVLLSELAESEPSLILGNLTCALALGQDLSCELDLPPELAREAFQRWIRALWGSRQTDAMVKFAENCSSVAAVFPWLEEFLAAETKRLQAE